MKKSVFSISDAKKYDIPGGECFLYPDSPTGRLSAALVTQKGRYPTTGYRKNDICTEAMLIIEGKFKLSLGRKIYQLKPNNIAYIPPGTPYTIEGKGKTFVFIEPKWDAAQNKPVDSL